METDDNDQEREERERIEDSSEKSPQMKLRDLSPEKDPIGAANDDQSLA
ncbi:MAG: hypothetical protein M3032_07820 [Verrucomicrobiota bacterium]|nr:hypothetical protein [Verrucomicrobiota bacterium]